MRELEDDLRAAQSRLEASEEVAFHKAEEIRNLQRALEIKAQELSIDSGVDVHSRLLFAVAKVTYINIKDPYSEILPATIYILG